MSNDINSEISLIWTLQINLIIKWNVLILKFHSFWMENVSNSRCSSGDDNAIGCIIIIITCIIPCYPFFIIQASSLSIQSETLINEWKWGKKNKLPILYWIINYNRLKTHSITFKCEENIDILPYWKYWIWMFSRWEREKKTESTTFASNQIYIYINRWAFKYWYSDCHFSDQSKFLDNYRCSLIIFHVSWLKNRGIRMHFRSNQIMFWMKCVSFELTLSMLSE